MELVKPELQLVCDFVNTLDRESGRDELGDAGGLGLWLRARGLWGGRPADDDAAAARALREALRELMRANNGEDVDTAAAAATLDAAARRAGIGVSFATGSIRLVAPDGGSRPGARRGGRGDGRRLVVPAEGVPLGVLPLGVRRHRAEPFAPVVLDERLRQPGEGAGLPAATRGGECVEAFTSRRRSCRRRSRSASPSACSRVRRTGARPPRW